MIVIPLILFVVGLFLSAFFSGSETGFYRAHRLRFVIDSMSGDRISKLMLRLFNNPSWFVSTALIGNNIANYLVSLSIVLFATSIGEWAEFTFPIIFTPLLFVYGELLPKNIFFSSPNYLLRLAAPLILFFAVIFAPVSIMLWGLSNLMERWIGQSPVKVKTSLARRELQQFLQEGQEAGILLSIQRHVAESFLLKAARPVREFCRPLPDVAFVRADGSIKDALELAERHRVTEIPVVKDKTHQIVGYVRTADLLLEKVKSKPLRRIRKLPETKSNELYGEVLIQMQSGHDTMMKVVNPQGQVIGLITLNELTNHMLEGPLDSLRR